MKKLLIGLSLFIIIFVVLGVFINGMNTGIGTESESTIEVPTGFNITNITENSIVLSNKESNFIISEVTHKSMDTIFDEYKQEYKNDTVEINTFDVDGVEVKGLTLKINNSYVHTNYYYEKNGIVYHIYPKGNYDENILHELIKSTKKRII